MGIIKVYFKNFNRDTLYDCIKKAVQIAYELLGWSLQK